VPKDLEGRRSIEASLEAQFGAVAGITFVFRCSSIGPGCEISWFAGVGSGVGWFSVSMRTAAWWCAAEITQEPHEHWRFSQWRVSVRFAAKLVAGILSLRASTVSRPVVAV
jgi:hypothetical protein